MKKSNKAYLYSTIFKLFLSKHYELVTIKDIEEATGMSRGAVFYYSHNKQSLFCDIVDAYFFRSQNLEDKLEALQHYEVKGASLLDFIHRFVKMVDIQMEQLQSVLNMEKAEASRAYLSFILEAQTYYPRFNEKMNAIFDAEMAIWEKVLTQAKESGEIKASVDVKYYARIFHYLYVGQCYHTSLKQGVNVAEVELYLMSIYMLIKS